MSSKITATDPPAPISIAAPAVRGGRPWSLARRLTAWYVVSFFIILCAAVVVLYVALADSVRREQDQFLANKTSVLVELMTSKPRNIPDLKEEVEETWAPRQYVRVYARVLDASGTVIVQSPHMLHLLPESVFPGPIDAPPETVSGVDLHTTDGGLVRALCTRAIIPVSEYGPTRPITMQVAIDTLQAHALLASYQKKIAIVFVAALLLCAVAGYALARRGLRPLNDIGAAVQRIRPTTLGQQLDTQGLAGELVVLAASFNEMLARLDDSFTRLSRFSADIAHELRTPVNNLRGEMEVALQSDRTAGYYRDVLGSALEECARLSRIIESLLFLARAENPRNQIRREPVDVSQELARVGEFYEAVAADADVALHIDCPGGLTVFADRTLLQRAVGNLISNALAHTPRQGRVDVIGAYAAGEGGSGVQVRVRDSGEGISAEDLPHVFDRFYRADRARSGAAGRANVGLGLAIVHSIVTMHGGSVGIESRPGHGTCVTLHFPGVVPRAIGQAPAEVQDRDIHRPEAGEVENLGAR